MKERKWSAVVEWMKEWLNDRTAQNEWMIVNGDCSQLDKIYFKNIMPQTLTRRMWGWAKNERKKERMTERMNGWTNGMTEWMNV